MITSLRDMQWRSNPQVYEIAARLQSLAMTIVYCDKKDF